VTSTEIEPAFKNSPEVNRLSKVPTFLLGRTHFRMEHSMPKGTMFEFDCPAGAVCDLFVFHVHEPPCSSGYNGNYPALLADDWTPMSCAPRLEEDAESYRSVGYYKQIGGQTKWTVPAVETDCLSYYGVFAGEGTSCEDNAYQNQNACLNAIAAGALCKWESNACVADLCPRPGGAAGGGKSKKPTLLIL